MTRAAVVVAAVVLALAGAADAGVHVVTGELPEDWTRGAIGLSVPGAGATVTRGSAMQTLLTGVVRSSYLPGRGSTVPKLTLDDPAPPVVLVALPPPGRTRNTTRYPIGVRGAGWSGLLTSDSTRIAGLVSLADVANGTLRTVSSDDPVAALRTLDDRIKRNARIRLPLTLVLVAAGLLGAVVAPRFAPRLFLLALAANLWLAGWWLVALLALGALVLPVGVAGAAVVTAYLVVLGPEPEAVALSPFGPSQAGRFYGLSNLLATIVLLPAVLSVARLTRWAAIALAFVSLVATGGSRFGADGGGLLVLLAAYGVLALRLHRTRLTMRTMALLSVLVVVAGLAVVGLDAAVGSSSHVTRAVGDGPVAVINDVVDRLRISWTRATGGIGAVIAVLASLVGVAFVATRRSRGPATDAILAGLAVSIVVNDTPTDVLGVGVAAAFVAWRFECASPGKRPSLMARLTPMRRATTLVALLVVVGTLAAAGCGGDVVEATPETVIGELPTDTGGSTEDLPALSLEGDAAAGKDLFAAQGCAACHTLTAAGASGTVGPNLDETKPSYELAVTRITLGQGGMPKFGDKLEAQQVADVAEFVASSAGQ
ncbi:MAG: cytochrome c [Gaiellales bacterium]